MCPINYLRTTKSLCIPISGWMFGKTKLSQNRDRLIWKKFSVVNDNWLAWVDPNYRIPSPDPLGTLITTQIWGRWGADLREGLLRPILLVPKPNYIFPSPDPLGTLIT